MAPICHDSACQALCRREIDVGNNCLDWQTCDLHCNHDDHACTCSGAAKLAELVEVAEAARKCLRQFGDYDDAASLDAALQPFREAKVGPLTVRLDPDQPADRITFKDSSGKEVGRIEGIGKAKP